MEAVPRRLLFVCGGNTCRSPMAAALASADLRAVTATSAGIVPGYAVAANAVTAVREAVGLDISSHEPRDVSDLTLEDFDVIVALDPDVAEEIGDERVAGARLLVWDIRDPYGGTLDEYRTCAADIRDAITDAFG